MPENEYVALDIVHQLSCWMIIALACIGVPINLFAIRLLLLKLCSGHNTTGTKRSMIHQLLLVLSVSDLFVVFGFPVMFCLPDIWPTFANSWPNLAPWLFPIGQITLLTSIYTTVLISLERYVRIVYICNLRICRFFNEDNFK